MENDHVNQEDLERRLSAAEEEIRRLRLEVQQLQAASGIVNLRSPYQSRMEQSQPQTRQNQAQISQNQSQIWQNQPQMAQNQLQARQNQPQMPQIQPQKIQKNTESFVGKHLMAVMASVLIFISLILLAKVITPMLTDGIKIFLMFALSFAFAGFGLYQYYQKKEQPFYLVLGTCGIGAIYVSLFVTAIYFQALSEVPLFVLLLIWAVAVLKLSVFKPVLFQAIGNAGIVISVFFGVLQCVGEHDETKFLILTVYFLAGAVIYLIANRKDKIALCTEAGIQTISVFMILFGTVEIDQTSVSFLMIGFIVLMIGILIFGIPDGKKKYGTVSGIFGILYTLLLSFGIMQLYQVESGEWKATEVRTIMILCTAVFTYILLEYKKRAQQVAGLLWEVLCAVQVILCCADLRDYNEILGTALPGILWIGYGIYSGRLFPKILGLCTVPFLFHDDMSLQLALFYTVILCAVCLAGMYLRKDQYNVWLKSAVCVILYFALHTIDEWELAGVGDLTLDVIQMFVLIGLCIAAEKTKFFYHFATGKEEKTFQFTIRIIHALLMMEILGVVTDYENKGILLFLSMLMAVALFASNVAAQMKKKIYQVYIGVKFTILMITFMSVFDAENYIFSIGLLAFAIVCVFAGFQWKAKGLRIYGLLLSMICVVKLILFDIKYEDTLWMAISFLVCGMLCFGISRLYYAAERKLEGAVSERG